MEMSDVLDECPKIYQTKSAKNRGVGEGGGGGGVLFWNFWNSTKLSTDRQMATNWPDTQVTS